MDLQRLEKMAELGDVDAQRRLIRERERRQISLPLEGSGLAAADLLRFAFGGNAKFTLVNTNTNTRLSFHLQTPRGKEAPHFVRVLTGPDNWAFLGTIFDADRGIDSATFRRSRKSHVGQDAKSVKTISWLLALLKSRNPWPKGLAVYHSGTCGCCGRELTVPTSIRIGIGPVCAENLGIGAAFRWTATLPDGTQHEVGGGHEAAARRNLRDVLAVGRLPNGVTVTPVEI